MRLPPAPTDSAINLAVFRIAVALTFLGARDLWSAHTWANLSSGARAVPPGSAWILSIAPLDATSVRAGTIALAIALAFGAAGLYARFAFALATLLGLWILAVPQLAGFVFREHHLLWFTALLAASPSSDALSVDAYLSTRKTRSAPAPSVAYAIPIRAAWILIAAIFFFPGFWKLHTSGLEWIWSDNLRNHLYAKWIQFDGFTPLFRIDHYPLVLRGAAAFTVAFELAFPILIFLGKKGRIAAVAAALAFHFGTYAFMGLDFSLLYSCYVVFIDWRPLMRRWIHEDEGVTSRPELAARLTAAILILGATIAGARNDLSGWPFACYPTFQHLAHATMPALEITAVEPDGTERVLDTGPKSQRDWALEWSLVGALDRAPSAERLEAYGRQILGKNSARELRFYRATISTIPEDRRRVLRRELLHSIRTE